MIASPREGLQHRLPFPAGAEGRPAPGYDIAAGRLSAVCEIFVFTHDGFANRVALLRDTHDE
jgi:hypothetical protein